MRTLRPSIFSALNSFFRTSFALATLACAMSLSAQNISTIAGNSISGSAGDGGAAVDANIRGANGLALDRFGNVYIADSLNNKVRKITLDGKISTVAGTGTAGFSGDGAAATRATLNYPVMLAFTAAGELLITDYGNHRVRRIGLDGNITTIAGTGTEGFTGDGGAATAAQLNNPIGIAVAGDGSVYVSDTQNHRIRKIATNGIITTVAGAGTLGFSGDGGAATAAQLNYPGAIVFDASGVLYIADYANNRVRYILRDGIISTLAGNGTAGFAGDAGDAKLAQISGPFALSVGPNGNVLIADQNNNRIRNVVADGTITTVAGGGTTAALGDGAAATAAFVASPSGLAVDAAGQVFISDRGNIRIRKVSSPMKLLTEYRLASADYFFYTSRDNEKFALDGLTGWSRTGVEFRVNIANDPNTKGLTRYFFDKLVQNKTRGIHFYTLADNEIAALNAANPGNTQTPGLPYSEGIEAYAYPFVATSTNGCPAASQTPVYRAFRGTNIAADNVAHRFTADVTVYNALVAAGWSGEGVQWCSGNAP
jgi:sugar lactone lactonase YvrE